MITVPQAQALIVRHARRLGALSVPLRDSLGYVLARNIRVTVGLPHWDNSAMDGFALRHADTRLAGPQNPVRLKIAGVIKAGDTPRQTIRNGEAIRIMTGAAIPRGANAVVAQEDAAVADGVLTLRRPVDANNHIRRKGEELRRGTMLPWKDTLVTPGTIGFLATLGYTRVKVYVKPAIAVLVTGSELVKPGRALSMGKIYDSNSAMLMGALHVMGIAPALVATVKDDPRAIRKALSRALRDSDTVIIVGGVSVGDYDYSKEILAALGVRTIFWKVSQKPGKPIYFGVKNQRLIFGLPGNPASAFVCFYEYVWPALRRQSGCAQPFLPRRTAISDHDIRPDRFKTVFLKAKSYVQDGEERIKILGYQASHMISSLHEANALAVIHPGKKILPKREKISCDLLP